MVETVEMEPAVLPRALCRRERFRAAQGSSRMAVSFRAVRDTPLRATVSRASGSSRVKMAGASLRPARGMIPRQVRDTPPRATASRASGSSRVKTVGASPRASGSSRSRTDGTSPKAAGSSRTSGPSRGPTTGAVPRASRIQAAGPRQKRERTPTGEASRRQS